VKAFSAKQHELGIYGSVGEIGVHHGKFLIPIVGNALAGEPAVALDLFEDQTGNVDTSGACACVRQHTRQSADATMCRSKRLAAAAATETMRQSPQLGAADCKLTRWQLTA
jgi:hypothetical protein